MVDKKIPQDSTDKIQHDSTEQSKSIQFLSDEYDQLSDFKAYAKKELKKMDIRLTEIKIQWQNKPSDREHARVVTNTM